MKKKNVFLRLASVLMMACLLTTCVISGTFAKYVTSQEGVDSARVAKWGVTIDASGVGTTFEKTDAFDDTSTGLTGNSVVSDTDVVAPGTEGTMEAITVSGTPEVAVKVTYTATLALTGWTVDSADYCPIVFTVNGDTYKIGDAGITNVAALESKIAQVITAHSETYDAGTPIVSTLTVGWAWAFTTGDANDLKDTALGNAATPAEISLTITTTVTQID